jgi:hypothetical protein
MKVVRMAPQTMHEARFTEEVFQGTLSFEEAMERLTTNTTKQQLRKDEEKDKTLRLEQF